MQIFAGLISLILCVTLFYSGQASSAEPRMVAFAPFSNDACPSGWRELDQAKGYVIVGTDDPANVGRKFGAPIEDRSAPLHDHNFHTALQFDRATTTFLEGDAQAVRIMAAPLRAGDSASKYVHTIAGHSSTEDGGVPYAQYRICEEIEPWRERLLPADTVQWFNGATCPENWQIYKPAIGDSRGRTIVPLPEDASRNDAALEVSTGRDVHKAHDHSIDVSLTSRSPEKGLASLDLVGFSSLTYSNTFHPIHHAANIDTIDPFMTGSSRRRDVETGRGIDRIYPVPFMYLAPCRKIAGTKQIDLSPLAGFGFFTAGLYCEDGFQEIPDGRGRYLVGLPPARPGQPEPLNGALFGGDPLKSGKLPLHRHSVSLPAKIPEITVAAPWTILFKMAGLRRKEFSEPVNLVGTTEESSVGLPYVQLRFCSVKSTN
ncbi:MAG: hypothetical protein RIG26_10175 [Thalassospira sp.]|uniref:hypothetical protein n=1 Tax=Thalassospira sp. TaxID=1912094 RepID=UPI0032F0254B